MHTILVEVLFIPSLGEVGSSSEFSGTDRGTLRLRPGLHVQ